MKLSVCLIVKDEELVLERCLACAKSFADEIVIVDTGSTDATKQIAKKFTDKIYDFKWHDDFACARNFAFSKAKYGLVMWLDADDIVLNDDIAKIQELKNRKKHPDMYMLWYVQSCDENLVPTCKFWRERIVKRSKNFKWKGFVHEFIPLSNSLEKIDISIYHKKQKVTQSDRNLKIYQKMLKKGVIFDAREQFFYARELYFARQYQNAIVQFEKFLDMPDGWNLNKVQACMDCADCFDLLGEKQKALDFLFLSMRYCRENCAVCYKIGNLLARMGRFDDSLVFLHRAMQIPVNTEGGTFETQEQHEFLPLLTLVWVYYKKNNMQKAYEMHLLSQKINPNSPQVKNNQLFFQSYLEKK